MKKPFVPVKDDRQEAPFWLPALIFVIITAVGVAGGSIAAVLIPYYLFSDTDGDVSRWEYERVRQLTEADTAGAAGFYVLSMKPGPGK